jgi:hypothetical protein
VLIEAIDADRYPLSPRLRQLRQILAKFGAIGSLPADLERKPRRTLPPTSAPRAGTKGLNSDDDQTGTLPPDHKLH